MDRPALVRVQSLGAFRVARRQHKLVAGQRLPLDDLAHVVCKMLERREAARLGMEMHKIKTPATFLPAAMLAHETVKPALKSARQVEIRAIDGEHERIIDHACIEPIRQDQLEPERTSVASAVSFTFVDPGEPVAPTFCWLADRGQHRR